jgi:TonB family protein
VSDSRYPTTENKAQSLTETTELIFLQTLEFPYSQRHDHPYSANRCRCCPYVSLARIVVPSRTDAQVATESARRVVNRGLPAYPDMARTMNLKGNVKVEVVVGPSGAVKSVEIKGGHPVLAKSAESAVFQWKWESAARETRELVETKFDP